MTKLFATSLATLIIFFMAVFIDAACKNSTKQEAPPTPPPAQVAPTPTPPTPPITPPTAKEAPAQPTVEKKEEVLSPIKDLGYGPKPAPDAGTVQKALPKK